MKAIKWITAVKFSDNRTRSRQFPPRSSNSVRQTRLGLSPCGQCWSCVVLSNSTIRCLCKAEECGVFVRHFAKLKLLSGQEYGILRVSDMWHEQNSHCANGIRHGRASYIGYTEQFCINTGRTDVTEAKQTAVIFIFGVDSQNRGVHTIYGVEMGIVPRYCMWQFSSAANGQ